MALKTALRMAAWSWVGWPFFTAGFALGQYQSPTDYKGVRESVLAAIDLAKEIDSFENRELRVSRAIIARGGHIGLHSRQGEPTIVYVLDGVLTNHQGDGTTEEFRPGQVLLIWPAIALGRKQRACAGRLYRHKYSSVGITVPTDFSQRDSRGDDVQADRPRRDRHRPAASNSAVLHRGVGIHG
jgi:quercetin dioxygenase-like cupin family protein